MPFAICSFVYFVFAIGNQTNFSHSLVRLRLRGDRLADNPAPHVGGYCGPHPAMEGSEQSIVAPRICGATRPSRFRLDQVWQRPVKDLLVRS